MQNTQQEKYVFYRFCTSDVQECYKTLLLLAEFDSEAVRFALIKSALVAYGRPFSGNEPIFKKAGRLKLPEGIVPERMLAAHRKALEYRNKFIAHTDLTYRKPQLFHAHRDLAIGHDAPGFNEIEEFSAELAELSRALLDILWGEVQKLGAELV